MTFISENLADDFKILRLKVTNEFYELVAGRLLTCELFIIFQNHLYLYAFQHVTRLIGVFFCSGENFINSNIKWMKLDGLID